MSRRLSSHNFEYFAVSLLKALGRIGFICPSCGCKENEVVSRKFIVTSLRRCAGCRLLFRTPTSTEEEFDRFYQHKYESGFTTKLPTPEILETYLAKNFSGTPKDFNHYIRVMNALGVKPGSRLLDLGCSWGYGAWQFERAGYKVLGLELSQDRAKFAKEKLGVDVVCNSSEIKGSFDIIFSSHVLEHIPKLQPIIDFCDERLNRDGYFIAVTPNGSAAFRAKAPARWNRMWGFVHPLFLDVEFWQSALREKQSFISSELNNLQAMRQWVTSTTSQIGNLDGWELIVAYKLH